MIRVLLCTMSVVHLMGVLINIVLQESRGTHGAFH
jgi:hypothetical protein